MSHFNSLASWSGGKDSCFALMQAIEQGFQPKVLLNMMNENGEISRSHALTKTILEQQANSMGLPIVFQPATWGDYEQLFIGQLETLTEQYQLQHAIFGDIDLEPHREWEEKVCNAAGITAQLPLWQQDRKALVLKMIDSGIETMITSCNETLGMEFLGRVMNQELIKDLEQLGVDVCGENGEFHTVVVNCPLFSKPIELPQAKKVIHGSYCFLDWRG